MSVCRVMRAWSKRLCFICSIARSNRTLSGCLEPTLASGLFTFLLVQAAVKNSNMTSDAINGVRRDIGPTFDKAFGRPRRPSLRGQLHLQECGFVRRFQ